MTGIRRWAVDGNASLLASPVGKVCCL